MRSRISNLLIAIAFIGLGMALLSSLGCASIRAVPSKRKIDIALSCGLASHVNDAVSTVMALRANAGREANLAAAHLPLPLMVAGKMGAAIWAHRVLWRDIAPVHPRAVFWAGAIQCVGVNAIAMHNWRVLQGGGR